MTSSGTDIGNRIQGFLKRMADNDLEVEPQSSGGGTEYAIYSIRGGERHFLVTVRSVEEMARLIYSWDENGWPISEGEGLGTSASGSDTSSTREAIMAGDFPTWADDLPRDRLLAQGPGDYATLPQQSLSVALQQVLPSLDGMVTSERATRQLLATFPKAIFNHKSISATISSLASSGVLRKVRKGLYRYTPNGGKKNGSLGSSPSSSKPTTDTPASGEVTLPELIHMGNWKMVGRSDAGTPIYALGETGQVYRIALTVERV